MVSKKYYYFQLVSQLSVIHNFESKHSLETIVVSYIGDPTHTHTHTDMHSHFESSLCCCSSCSDETSNRQLITKCVWGVQFRYFVIKIHIDRRILLYNTHSQTTQNAHNDNRQYFCRYFIHSRTAYETMLKNYNKK